MPRRRVAIAVLSSLISILSLPSGAAPASARAPDVQPPALVSFDYSPHRINLESGPQQITVTVRVTDETGLSGTPTMLLASQTTTQTQGFGSMSRLSGTAQDGTYQRTVTMPANVAPGAWDVLIYPLDDTIGNHGSFTAHPEPLMVRYGDAVPNAPTGVTATAGDGTADVHWTAPSSDQPIDSYTVTATPGGRQVTVGGAVTSALFDGLNNGTPYTFSVVATSSIGTSPASVPSNSVTPATVPSAPSNVTAIPGDTSAQVRWSAPNNGGAPVTGYFLTVSPGGQTIQVAGSVTTRTVTGLTNGAAYSFTVVAANRVGQSPPSEPSNQVTPAGVPARISKPAAAVTGRSVTLTWVAPGANGSPVTGYVVRWAGKSKRVPAPTTSLILNALKPGKYKFSVAAVNAIGTGPASPARSVKIK